MQETDNRLNNKILSVILLLSFLVSCGQAQEKIRSIEIPFEGIVLYVEDIDGRDGLSANPFGDLVMLNANKNMKRILTNDSYYYSNPNLTSNGQSIIVESKRSRNIGLVGLSAPSKLYEFDVETGQIKSFKNEIYLKTSLELGRLTTPSVSPSENLIVVQHYHYGGENFMAIDFKRKQILQITNKEKIQPSINSSITWSPDNQQIIYNTAFLMGRNPLVLKFDFTTSKLDTIWSPNSTKNLYDIIPFCEAGNWANNYSFVYVCRKAGSYYSQIYSYDIIKSEKKVIAEIDSLHISSLHISKSGDYLVFIGSTKEAKDDVYLYDIINNKLINVTLNGFSKGWLRWYE